MHITWNTHTILLCCQLILAYSVVVSLLNYSENVLLVNFEMWFNILSCRCFLWMCITLCAKWVLVGILFLLLFSVRVILNIIFDLKRKKLNWCGDRDYLRESMSCSIKMWNVIASQNCHQKTTLHNSLSPVIWHLLCLEDVNECFHYTFWFVSHYHMDCLYREFIWSACFSFRIFAICFFNWPDEKHSSGPSVFAISSSCSLGFSELKSL